VLVYVIKLGDGFVGSLLRERGIANSLYLSLYL